MKKIAIYLCISLITLCCQTRNKDIKTSGIQTVNPEIPTDTNQFYYPANLFVDTNAIGLDTMLVKWYSNHLFALKEPLIFNDSTERQIFRFLWLRTFHNPIAIRIEKEHNTYNLCWKLSSGAGGYEPGNLVIDKSKTINKAVWNEFISRLMKVDFWNLKTTEERFGLDGSRWILEGKSSKYYHVVDRWTPSEGSDFYKCCNFLIEQTDLNITGDDKY